MSIAAARQLLSLETGNASSPSEENRLSKTSIAAASDSASFELSASPNPFNPETMIHYQIDGEAAQEVSLVIFNTLGQQVRKLVQARHNPGDHSVVWDGRDNFGKEAASGMYFLQAVIGGKALTRKLMLVR